MKKIFIVLIMAALVLPAVALTVKAEEVAEATTVSAQEEKISTPAEMKDFTNIKKIGNALYGNRIMKMIINKIKEKISAPAEVKDFTNIKKIGNSLFGNRIMSRVASSTEITAEAVTCVQTALAKRDDAVSAALEVYASEVKTAMQTRKTAYLAALAIANRFERAKVMVNAFTTYKKAKNEAKTKHNQSVKSALTAYKSDLKNCKVEMGQDLDTSEADNAL